VGLLAIVGCFIENSQTCFAENATSVLETKNKLKRLNDQINQLKKTLSHVQDKRGVLNQELANTQKQIGV
jgi:peptidoglycan hydrolase CwlO-like protein